MNKFIKLAEGTEGIVFVNNNMAYKLYKTTKDYSTNIKELLKIKLKRFACITKLDVSSFGVVGYYMDRYSGITLKNIDKDILIDDFFKIVINLENLVAYAASKNVNLGDVNEENILVDENYICYIIDIGECKLLPNRNKNLILKNNLSEIAITIFDEIMNIDNNALTYELNELYNLCMEGKTKISLAIKEMINYQNYDILTLRDLMSSLNKGKVNG